MVFTNRRFALAPYVRCQSRSTNPQACGTLSGRIVTARKPRLHISVWTWREIFGWRPKDCWTLVIAARSGADACLENDVVALDSCDQFPADGNDSGRDRGLRWPQDQTFFLEFHIRLSVNRRRDLEAINEAHFEMRQLLVRRSELCVERRPGYRPGCGEGVERVT